MFVFAIYDSKVETYQKPFFMLSKGQALRAWIDLINDQQSEVSKHPEDFTLFLLGSYDENTGKFENEATPQSLGVAIEYRKEKK